MTYSRNFWEEHCEEMRSTFAQFFNVVPYNTVSDKNDGNNWLEIVENKINSFKSVLSQ